MSDYQATLYSDNFKIF